MNLEKKNRIYRTTMLVALTAFVTFMITTFCMYTYILKGSNLTVGNLNENTADIDLNTYTEKIRSAIDKYYLWKNDIDEEKLENSAIEGYVSGLGDEYSQYIPKSEMEEFTEEVAGNFVGIGIYMVADEKSGRIVVYNPIPESPAEEVGIKAGDLIISVDGTEYTSEDFDKIADYIKGEEGTTVNIEIERNGERKKFDIVRKKVQTNPVVTKIINENIGYLNLQSFDDDTASIFKEKVEDLQKQGAKSLIIDLRNNGGGIVDEATEIADDILKKGDTIITTVDNADKKEVTFSEKNPIFDMPIVVLVNENTASASEILACSLQDNGKAKIVGTTTFGKGVIQTIYTLTDGSGLKITTAEYYTPKGNKIHKIGIKPDEEVSLPNSVTNIYNVEEKDDTQLQKAIEILK